MKTKMLNSNTNAKMLNSDTSKFIYYRAKKTGNEKNSFNLRPV